MSFQQLIQLRRNIFLAFTLLLHPGSAWFCGPLQPVPLHWSPGAGKWQLQTGDKGTDFRHWWRGVRLGGTGRRLGSLGKEGAVSIGMSHARKQGRRQRRRGDRRGALSWAPAGVWRKQRWELGQWSGWRLLVPFGAFSPHKAHVSGCVFRRGKAYLILN